MNNLTSNNLKLTQKQFFLNPLRQFLETIEQTKPSLMRCSNKETSTLCLSEQPAAVMNVWETLIEAQKNLEFVKFMISMEKTEDDIKGDITGWNVYKHKKPLFVSKKLDGSDFDIKERLIYMPETKTINEYGRPQETLGPLNPYRCFKTAHATVSRTMRNIESLDLEFVYSIVTTFPSEVSNLYLETPRPIEIDRRILKCVKQFADYLSNLFVGKIGMSANIHSWSSMKPLEPHSHAHLLLFDRIIKDDGSEEQLKPYYFMRFNERTKRYEEGVLSSALKKNWTSIVNKEFGLDYEGLDINFEFVELKQKDSKENVTGHRKIIHKLKYNRRRPISDLALFYLFNEFDCLEVDDEYCEHLINYGNRTHVYGYWNRMSKYARKPIEKPIEHARCPFCNDELVYVSFHEGKELPSEVRKVFIDRKGRAWVVKGVS